MRRTIAAVVTVLAVTGGALVGAPVAEARVQPRPTPLPGEPIPEGTQAALAAASIALRGHPPTGEESGSWAFALALGMDPEYLARIWIALDEGRAEGVATELYEDTLGRAPDAAGLAYWAERLLADEAIFRLEAGFWASPELYQRAGGTDVGYVNRLYTGILGRSADAAGRDFWVGRLAAGVRRSTVALRFLNTPEVRGTKADGLFRTLFGRPATPAERIEWGPLLVTLGDAGRLVASEAYRRHVSPPTAGPTCALTPVPGTTSPSGTAASLSDDGAQVVFASTADGLVSGDADGESDVFLWDAGSGRTTLLSTGEGAATGPSISANGAFVTWSRDSEVDVDERDIEVWERATGGITRLTTGPWIDTGAVVSDDGQTVTYVRSHLDPAWQPGSPTDPGPELLSIVVVLDRDAGTSTTLPSVLVSQLAPSMSPDGRFVAYQASGRTPIANGVPKPIYTAHTVALWDRTTGAVATIDESPGGRSATPVVSDDGAIVAVGQIDLSDPNEFQFASTWDVAADEVTQTFASPNGVALSGDGSTHAFATERPLVAGDDEYGRDVHVRDLATGGVERVTDDLDDALVHGASHDGAVLLVQGTTIGGSGRTTYLCDRTA